MSEQVQFSQQANTAFTKKEAVPMVWMMVLFTGTMMTTKKNKNSKSGTLPDGEYNRNTKIEFCCRTDANENKPVVLHTKEPFYLLAYKLPRCQMVKWAVSSLEWIYYDTEHWSNHDDRGGAYPYNAATQHPTIYYCYYRG